MSDASSVATSICSWLLVLKYTTYEGLKTSCRMRLERTVRRFAEAADGGANFPGPGSKAGEARANNGMASDKARARSVAIGSHASALDVVDQRCSADGTGAQLRCPSEPGEVR